MTPASEPQISPADGSLMSNPPTFPGDPPCNHSTSACTPIHSRYHTTERYGISNFSRDNLFTALADNISPYILGPMPPGAFLDRFLPLHSLSVPEDTPSFQEGILAGMLPPTGATGAASRTGAADAADAAGANGATKFCPYTAIVRLVHSLNKFLANLFV
jgi:hypothetical protein